MLLGVALALATSGCTELPSSLGSAELGPARVFVQLVDEQGDAIAGAVDGQFGEFASDADGRVVLRDVRAGMALRARAAGFLDEPFVVGRGDGVVQVRLFRSEGRTAFHFGGDFMMGRRFETGRDADTPALVREEDREGDARRVVSDLAPLFSVGDLNILNYESVISTRGLSEAYPDKLFLLTSHPDTLSSLDELAVDAVVLANNHIRDWLDAGTADTINALEEAGFPHVGAGMSEEDARAPIRLEHAGRRIEMLAYAGLSGDPVNDNLPTSADPVPEGPIAADAFKYELRPFVFETDRIRIREEMIIGDAWQRFRSVDGSLTDSERATFWAALEAVYPELQDWVARRGHGGANRWRSAALEDIADAKARADLVIVQVHTGFQYQPAPPGRLRELSRDAIDAGADLVVTHHPHVLQGAEFYKGRLILYSLGNFVFDQNFHVTYPSAFARIVWDDAGLVAARLIPFELQDYRPVPLVGEGADRVFSQVLESSLSPGTAFRKADGTVAVGLDDVAANVIPARVTRSGAVEPISSLPETTIALEGGETVRLDPGYWELADAEPTIQLGRDIFGWGHFEDSLLDDQAEVIGHMIGTSQDRMVVALPDAPEGERYLRMRRAVNNATDLLIRPVSRLPLPESRLVAQSGEFVGDALDGAPTYSMRVWARIQGRGQTSVRLRVDNYFFDDSTPNEDAVSELLSQQFFPLEFPQDGEWHLVEIPFSPDAGSGEREVRMILPYIIMAPTDRYDAVLDLDGLEFIEWRDAAPLENGTDPQLMGAWNYARNIGPASSQVLLRHVSLE